MAAPNNQVARQQPPDPAANLGALQGLLEKHKSQIAVALPRHMTPERMIRVAMTAYGQNPGLAECTPVSIAASIVQSSILGLEPSSVLGESYLVPFFNGKTKRNECQLIPGYQGLVKLARNSGEVSLIDAQVVYSNDHFDFQKGSDTWWVHKWARTGPRGTPDGVWAGYVLKDGSKNFEYWSIEQIEEHRDKYSKGAFKKYKGEYVLDENGQRILTGAWADSPEWMWKKTVLRQAIKLMPKSVELSTALKLDELGEVSLPQHIDVLPGLPDDDDSETPSDQSADPQAAPQRKSDTAPRAATLSDIRKLEPTLTTANWKAFLPEGAIEKIRSEEEARAILQKMREVEAAGK